MENEFPGLVLSVRADSNNSARSVLRACTHHIALETNGAFPAAVQLLIPLLEPLQGIEGLLLGGWSKSSKDVK